MVQYPEHPISTVEYRPVQAEAAGRLKALDLVGPSEAQATTGQALRKTCSSKCPNRWLCPRQPLSRHSQCRCQAPVRMH